VSFALLGLCGFSCHQHMAACVQVALLTNRTAVMPDMPCISPWIHTQLLPQWVLACAGVAAGSAGCCHVCCCTAGIRLPHVCRAACLPQNPT
jgi:hypothetical protein